MELKHGYYRDSTLRRGWWESSPSKCFQAAMGQSMTMLDTMRGDLVKKKIDAKWSGWGE